MLDAMAALLIVHGEGVTEIFIEDGDHMVAQLQSENPTATEVLLALGYPVKEEWLRFDDDPIVVEYKITGTECPE